MTDETAPILLREDSEGDAGVNLRDIPAADERAPLQQLDGEQAAHSAITASDLEDDKKKLTFSTAYDGFSIYGRILYLVIKRRATSKGKGSDGAGQAMMEDWIVSTQLGAADLND